MRRASYCTKPGGELQARIAQVEGLRLLVIQELGPASFVLRDEASKRITVRLGDLHSCSLCGGADVCVHMVRKADFSFDRTETDPLLGSCLC
jgi:hypothetical protein